MFERLLYFMRRALRNMRQSPFLCTAAIGTVAVSLAIMAFFAIIVLNVQQVTRHWSQEVQVVAYLDQVPQEEVLKGWIDEIVRLPEVEGVSFVSRSEAFEAFGKRLGADSDLLDGLDKDILPASLEIALKEDYRNRQGVATVVDHLRAHQGLSDLRYGQDWLERFESFLDLLRFAGFVLGGFLLFAALFIVSNTIKLTLYARREELEIMVLVGGTPLFIKIPFLLEGALQGALGGLVALGFSYGLFQLFLQRGLSSLLLASGVGRITFLPVNDQVFLIAAGTALGLVGSLVALRKFVRV